jgi:hypothetical protein
MTVLPAARVAHGESGVAGLAPLRLVAFQPVACAALRSSDDRRILLFGKNGTDTVNCYRILCSRQS